MKVEKGKLVELQYQMSFDSYNGEVIEATELNEPLQFVVGDGELLPKFEKNIMGMKVGDKFRFKIGVDDAFGRYDESAIMAVPRKDFDENPEYQGETIEEGDVITLFDEDGEEVPVEVLEVTADSYVVDLNHPYAEEDLYFQGTVISIENA